MRGSPWEAAGGVILTCYALAAKRKVLWICALCAVSFAAWPVDALLVRPESAAGRGNFDRPAFTACAPLGQEFRTGYIHSLERTAVLDEYRIVNGRIWSWRESTRSHNAGLPFDVPRFGRFTSRPPWMVLEGGRQAWPELVLRVGDVQTGRNVFAYGGAASRVPLYARFPGRRLLFEVARLPLGEAIFITRRNDDL